MSKLQYFLVVLMTVHVFANIAAQSNQLNKFGLKPNSKGVVNPSICMREAKCEPIQNTTCFGTAVPYTHMSLALAEDSISPLDIQDNLALWQGLRTVPRCWAVVQPLLCAVYMPKCENGTLSLPSQEMCRMTRGPCRGVEVKHGWPPFLRCENKKIFPPRCWNPLQEVKFNTSAKCVPPLVESDNSESWYDGIEGCGLQCQDPLFTAHEHEELHRYIKVMASLCVVSNLFAVLTFVINCKHASRYPSGIIVCVNICLFFASCGWLLQFYPGNRETIACLPDGTVRRNQPNFNGLWCVLTFVFIYSFTIAALVWFVILGYAWRLSFQKRGATGVEVGPKNSNFHLWAWSIALLLTVTAMATMQVDGNFTSGICFVGYSSDYARAGFVVVPVLLAIFVGGAYLIANIYNLLRLRKHEVPNRCGNKRINSIIFKLIIFLAVCVLLVLCTCVCHMYDYVHRDEWEHHLRDYLVCLATLSAAISSHNGPCELKGRPSIWYKKLHFFSFFGFSFIMSLWVWRISTFEMWRQFFSRFCDVSGGNPLAAKVCQLLAKTSPGQDEGNDDPKVGPVGNHGDPIGMNIDVASIMGANVDVNSQASRDMSSTVPQLLGHRSIAGGTVLNLKQYSSASDVSTRRISLDSFQHNLDSLSLQISEQEYAHVLRHQRRKTRKERERFIRANRIAPWFPSNRRGSDTSLQSSILAASVAAAAASSNSVTKSTSTGDLMVVPMLPPVPATYVVSRQLTQKPTASNLPFTHGMADNSHCTNLDTMKKQLQASYLNPQETTPGDTCTSRNSYAAICNQNYNYVPQMPYTYFPGSMYPQFPRYPQIPGNVYGPSSYLQYNHFQVPETVPGSCQEQLIPLQPIADSASEAEYLPIILSDSEFTDGGHRSFDEAQLLSAQRLLQEHSLQKAALMEQVPSLQPRIHFSREVASPPFGHVGVQPSHNVPKAKKSPPSPVSAPPPSPVDSEGSDTFPNDNSVHHLTKSSSKQSVKSEAYTLLSAVKPQLTKQNSDKSIFQRLKSSMRRASSFSHGIVDSENLELHLKASRLSLRGSGCVKEFNETKENLLGEWNSHCSGNVTAPTLTVSADTSEGISR